MKVSERSFRNKHNVYYVDGLVVKKIEEVQTAMDEHRLIEKFDKRNGDMRYLDYNAGKWFRKQFKKEMTK